MIELGTDPSLVKIKSKYKVQDWHNKAKNKEIFVIDCGGRKNQFFVLDAKKRKFFSMTKQEFMNLPIKHPGCIIIIECAHLESRTNQSLAQPLTSKEKDEFYYNCNISGSSLKLFPERKTPKARKFVAKYLNPEVAEKKEKNDVIAIYLYLKYFEKVYHSLSSKDTRKDPLIKEGKEYRKETNKTLNIARSNEYYREYSVEGEIYQDKIIEFIEKHTVDFYNNLSEPTRKLFGIIKNTRGIRIEKKCIKHIYTIASTLLDIKGNKRVRKYTQKPPGWKFVSDRELCLNPNRGGISKSNLNQHLIPHYIKAQAKNKGLNLSGKRKTPGELSKLEYLFLITKRAQAKKCIKELFLLCKSLIWER
jgi:hypothetical protein